jgi:serine/threonine-protein kinase
MSMMSCGISVQLSRQPRHESAISVSNLSNSVRIDSGIVACEECGSTSRVGRGLCLNCLLRRGLGCETETSETLEQVLDEVDVRDADWRIGNYQILEEIGRGGMGVIYRARQKHSLRIVGLKRILSFHADSRETLARFRREAEAAASLDHPNILPIYEVSESDDGLPFFSMKFAAGGSLLDAAPGLRDDPRRIVALMAKVTRAVQHAHGHGILHRDLKPGNILLDGCGEPLVSDFGLAKWLDTSSDLTRTLTIFGTPGYIAPEQAQGPAKNVTPAADIYSIGAVLFDLFTGKTPFVGEHALAVIKQASENPAPKLRTLARSADRDLETICTKCLEREPQARYHSAGDLAEDLERWLEGRPIVARPVSPPVRIWRWSKRNPKLASSVAATAVLGMLLLAVAVPMGSSWFLTKPPPAIPEKSVAVLPFENLSDEQQNAYFTDGVHDEILDDLARVADLKVISRTSVMQYKSSRARNLREVAKALGVAHIVEGTVQRAGGRVRVSAQLIDARTDTHIWGDHYDRDLADVFAIQSEIAKMIADQLQAKLSTDEKVAIGKAPTTDLTAYDLYLRAKALFVGSVDMISSGEQLREAERLLNETVSHDPHFPLAWCLLARVHCEIYFHGYDHTQTRLELANVAVQSALRLQPDAGEAHLALANYYYYGFRDYTRTRAELAIARRTLPNNAEVFKCIGYVARREGHWEEATLNLERAVELDPRNVLTLQQLAPTYDYQRRYADEVRILDRALAVVPGDPIIRMLRAEVALDWRADIKPFQTVLGTLIAENPSIAPGLDHPNSALCERTAAAAARLLMNYPREGVMANYGVNFPHSYWEAVVARWQGDSAKAQAAFTTARREVQKTVEKQPEFDAGLSLLGMIDAGLGEKEKALREGRRACELLPISKDALDGMTLAINLAKIYTWIGEKDLAIEQIAAVQRVPNELSYGSLKLNPIWDPLRGNQRFEKIVTSLAPKETVSTDTKADLIGP